MDGTIVGQGSFVANFVGLTKPNAGNASQGQANPTIIQIPSGADWVSVRNYGAPPPIWNSWCFKWCLF